MRSCARDVGSCARDVGSFSCIWTYVSCTWTHCASPLLTWRDSTCYFCDEDINFAWHCTWFHIMMKRLWRRYRLCFLMMTLYLVLDHDETIMTKISTLFDDDIVPRPRSVGSDRSCIYSYILDLLTCQRCIAINLSQNTKYTTANTKYTPQIQKNMP